MITFRIIICIFAPELRKARLKDNKKTIEWEIKQQQWSGECSDERNCSWERIILRNYSRHECSSSVSEAWGHGALRDC